ncbi:MAG: ferric reductase-like transmembrane domain-containing protein [Candidatus Promineifilaceae bacterium]
MTAAAIWGLILSSKFLKEIVPGQLTLAMHNYLSWAALGLTVLHAVLLLFTGFMDYTVINLVVPFTGPYRPFWVGLGIIGLYLTILNTITFYMRNRIGYRRFHVIHYLTYGLFVAALLHSWVFGTDTTALEMVYTITGFVVFFLIAYRIVSMVRRPETAELQQI